MGHRRNYNWMLFPTPPMASVRAQTHGFVHIRQMLYPLDHGCSLKDKQCILGVEYYIFLQVKINFL